MKKEKIKDFVKKYLIGFILGVLSAAVVVVYAETYFPSNQVTYDNTESGLSSTNVQTAIDELYNTCFPKTSGDQIIENAGLEKDEYECRYFFTGANPNNYITFNNEKAGWRIISVECDGTIKIMRTASIGNIAWDTSHINNWARPATLNTYLNSTYYYELNNTARSQIVASNFSIGAVTYGNNNMSTQVSNENATKWYGNIALPTVSEYIRTNSNKSSCGTFSLINDNYTSCVSTGWMDTTSVPYWWILPSMADASYGAFYVDSRGAVSYYGSVSITSNAVRPALYLSSSVKLSGSGTSSNPYTIELSTGQF